MNERADKSQSRKKKYEKREHKCSVMAASSVATIAESAGYANLSEDVLKIIAEDVTYKLRELIHCCCVHTRHTKQHMLTTRTVNSVLRLMSKPFVDGHINKSPLDFLHVEGSDLFVVDDPVIDLPEFALSEEQYVQCPDVQVYRDVLYPKIIGHNEAPSTSDKSETHLKNEDIHQEDTRKIDDNNKDLCKKAVVDGDEESKVNHERDICRRDERDEKNYKSKHRDKVDPTGKDTKIDEKESRHRKEDERIRKEYQTHKNEETKVSKESEHGHHRQDQRKISKEDGDVRHKIEEKRSNSSPYCDIKYRKEDDRLNRFDNFAKPYAKGEDKVKKYDNTKKSKHDSPVKDKKHEKRAEKEEKLVCKEQSYEAINLHKKIKKEKECEKTETGIADKNKINPVMAHNVIYPNIPPHLFCYYQQVCRGILTDSPVMFSVILKHLKTSCKINAFAPFFLNFACEAFAAANWGSYLSQKLLYVIDSIAYNKYINVEGLPVAKRVVLLLVKRTLNVEESSRNNYEFRKTVGSTVGKVIDAWCREDKTVEAEVERIIITILEKGSYPSQYYYGVMAILLSLGSNALGYCFWPYFHVFEKLLNKYSSKCTVETMEFEDSFLMVVRSFFRQSWELGEYIEPVDSLYKLLVEYFGDRLSVIGTYGLSTEEIITEVRRRTSSDFTSPFDMDEIERPPPIRFPHVQPVNTFSVVKKSVNSGRTIDKSKVFETSFWRKLKPFKLKIKWVRLPMMNKNDSARDKIDKPLQIEWLSTNTHPSIHKIWTGQMKRRYSNIRKSCPRPRRSYKFNCNPSDMISCHNL